MSQKNFPTVMEENKTRMHEIASFRDAPISVKAQKVALGTAVVGGGVMAAIFATQIISGALALAVVGVVAIVGFYGVRIVKQADPLIQQKLKNNILKRMIEEASTNAIEQLQGVVISKAETLAQSRKSRDMIGAQVESLKDSVAKASEKNKPGFQKTLDAITNAYTLTCENVERMAHSNKAFEDEVANYREKDSFNKKAGIILSTLEENGAAKLEEILSLEAFSSIDEEFNTATIALENSAKDAALDAA